MCPNRVWRRSKKGKSCEILLDALPQDRFNGVVHSIVPTADRSKATVMVKVSFLERDPRILPEMSAKVAFLERPVQGEEQQPRVMLPKAALVRRDGKSYVYLLKGDASERPWSKLLPPGGSWSR